MRTSTLVRTMLCGIGAALLCKQPFAATAAYPDKPVRLVVPFAAGGPADVVAREIGLALGKELGQPVVVDNLGGGAGLPAMNAVTRAAPDGYTLLFAASGNIVIQPLLTKGVGDAAKRLSPVGMVSTSPHVLVVSAKLPVHNAAELIAYAKANPGKVYFGSAGVGGLAHLGMEQFKATARIDIGHVPYKGTSQVVNDLVSGEVQALFTSYPSLKGMIEKGAIRAIGVTAPSTSPSLKNIPVISNSGLPGFQYTTWYGIYSTAGTPAPVMKRLNDVLINIGSDKVLRDRLDAQGVDLHVTSAEELNAQARQETAQWSKVIRSANVTLN
ncbi:tripartite tricarboxylate transporter substrate binding protein [Cupriavidus sp. BIS7]|uniref:Bug family tripartite tricarboxylate transporter substrate binding protein n=1 Tax=Cupriavidus sp. BIS7 TaxID=1217718 RepID=UPI000302252E|nr:tripartite tricarboxylate transporter substrate binding protein [Cupriavidus sp. BIS7]